jgi:hypothetical protein
MTLSDQASHNHCTHKFVELANELKDQGYEVPLVSGALMAASGIYATYSVAGNEGGLNPSGVDKVVDRYRGILEHIQNRKREETQKREEAEKGAG